MTTLCAWQHNHEGNDTAATNIVILPGESDGGTEWFGEPEPNIRLALCDPCTGIFKANNGERVIVEPIANRFPGEPFAGKAIEAI